MKVKIVDRSPVLSNPVSFRTTYLFLIAITFLVFGCGKSKKDAEQANRSLGANRELSSTSNPNDNKGSKSDASITEKNQTSAMQDEKASVPVGQVLKTRYFDVTVQKVSVQRSVKTGNMFADLKPQEGTYYLILKTTFKNTDDESRMLIDGDLIINYNGKEYVFDKSETIMLDGWGLFLDKLNPLMSKTTNLVYKIPDEVEGPAYYRPGRAGKEDLIFLGNIAKPRN